MKKYRSHIAFALLCTAFVMGLFYMQASTRQNAGRKPVALSVVVYSGDAERWRTLDQGIAQACTELGIEKPTLTILPPGSSGMEQSQDLAWELQNGTQGILIAAADSESLRQQLPNISFSIPVVAVESGAGEGLPPLGADNWEMGAQLARRVADTGEKVVLLRANDNRDSVTQRRQGFLQQAQSLGCAVEVWDLDTSQTSPQKTIAEQIAAQSPAVLVALDNETLEYAAAANQMRPGGTRLYGVGTSPKVIHALDAGYIYEVCFQNEFSIGYLGMMQLARQMKLTTQQPPAQFPYHIITRDNMYDTDIQRLIFPMIQ